MADGTALPDHLRRFAVSDDGCWLWLGSMDRDGYGMVQHEGRRTRAHRVTYEVLVGPIPDGLVIDHLCRVRGCVNPDHLEPVTNAENVRRGETGQVTGERKRAMTHCAHGHPFTAENTYWRQGQWRCCRACARRRRAAYKSTVIA